MNSSKISIDNAVERINELTCQYKIPIVLFLVGSVLVVGGFLSTRASKPSYPKESMVVKGVSAQSEVKVDIAGAIVRPGVYSLPRDSRIEDAIKAASGFSTNADPEYIAKKLNLSLKISDGMKIYIPRAGESAPASIGTSSTKIGINSASTAELEKLPGIGAVSANKIITGRPYSSVDDLLTKKAVSKAVFEKIKELVDSN